LYCGLCGDARHRIAVKLAKRRARRRTILRVEPDLNALGDFLDAWMNLDEAARAVRRFAPMYEPEINAMIRSVLHGEAPRIASALLIDVKLRVTHRTTLAPLPPREDLHDIFQFHDDAESQPR
jgi:hypothetical protein